MNTLVATKTIIQRLERENQINSKIETDSRQQNNSLKTQKIHILRFAHVVASLSMPNKIKKSSWSRNQQDPLATFEPTKGMIFEPEQWETRY